MEIETVGVIAKFSDGKIRQILTNAQLNETILSLIMHYNDGKIRVSDETINTLEILTKKED